jgi:hypothetical protein
MKNKPRHIREIKPIRDRLCARELSDDFEYAGDVAFEKFKTLKAFYAAHPDKRRYYTKHCTRQKVPVATKDSMGGVYVKANTRWKCDKLNGQWDPSALSRDNYRMLGACFVTSEEKKCAKHDHPQLMATKHGKATGSIPLTTISHARSRCGQDRTGCGWVPATGKCHAKRTIQTRKDAAARTIQTQERLRQLRKHMKIAKNIQMKNAAARVIQRHARLKQLRALRAKHAAARVIQDRYRAKRRAERETRAAKLIQEKLRDRLRRKQIAAKQIQNTVRKHQGRADKLPADWPTNLRTPGVDKYLLEYYQKKKSQWPVPSSGKYGGGCFADKKEPLFTAPQAILHAIARGMKFGRNRGLLAWHSTGSGKTCSAAAVMDAYWKTNKNIVFCTSVEAKQMNPPETFRKCINTFLKRGITEAQMTRRVQFFSFAQLAHYLQLYRGSGPEKNKIKRATLLDNAVLIIDEVQNLLKPLPNQVAEHKALYNYLAHQNLPGLNVFIFTATPGETKKDVVDLLNLVRDRRHAPITLNDTLEEFRTKTRGLIQHYDTNHDLSRFPHVIVQPPNVCRMSTKQQVVYAKALQEDLAKKTTFPNPKYMALSRKYASHTFTRDGATLTDFSCKIPQIHQKLREYPTQKHWLYSAFYESRGYGQGVMAVKKTLTDDLGYEELTPRMAKHMLASNTYPTGKRFCVVTTTSVKDRQELGYLVSVYNSPQNVHGAVCHVMLASQKFNEGMDLKAVRHIHMLEPLVTVAMRQQAIGRARRNCSHFQLNDMKDWTVQIHDYFSEPTVVKYTNNPANTLRTHQETLSRLMATLESIKGVRGVKAQRDQLTADIRTTKQNIKSIQQQQKEQTMSQGLFSVDRHVDELARAEYEPIKRLLDVMRDNSVDRLI